MWSTEASSGIECTNAATSSKDDGHNTIRHWTNVYEATATLENIPPELRGRILSNIQDLQTLKSLVRASPTYHEQYRLDRDRLLKNCLESELEGFYVDALATCKSRVCQLGRRRDDKIITNFLDSYKFWTQASDSAEDIPQIDSPDIHWLCSFHLSVVLPLADLFCQWAFANLKTLVPSSTETAVYDGPVTEAKHMGLSMLSKSEKIRILRALYRCENYCHLFGKKDGDRFGDFQNFEIVGIFFNIFEPWEAEEVGCIEFFMWSKYTDVFNRVKADLHPKSPRFDDQTGNGGDPDGSHELDILWEGESHQRAESCAPSYVFTSLVDLPYLRLADWDGTRRTIADYMEGTIALGIKTITQILLINDHDELVDKMAGSLNPSRPLDAYIEDSLNTMAQRDRREDLNYTPNVKDEAEGVNSMSFLGDTVPPRGPPSAWVLLWGGMYVNIYGEYVPEPLKESGCVMWDECRLDISGIKKVIADQWKTVPELVEDIKRDYPRLGDIWGSTDVSS